MNYARHSYVSNYVYRYASRIDMESIRINQGTKSNSAIGLRRVDKLFIPTCNDKLHCEDTVKRICENQSRDGYKAEVELFPDSLLRSGQWMGDMLRSYETLNSATRLLRITCNARQRSRFLADGGTFAQRRKLACTSPGVHSCPDRRGHREIRRGCAGGMLRRTPIKSEESRKRSPPRPRSRRPRN